MTQFNPNFTGCLWASPGGLVGAQLMAESQSRGETASPEYLSAGAGKLIISPFFPRENSEFVRFYLYPISLYLLIYFLVRDSRGDQDTLLDSVNDYDR